MSAKTTIANIEGHARFIRWFDWLMGWEGTVYENDPDDAGGVTKFGIDQRSHPSVNIRDLTREQAKQIYWNEYWSAVRAGELPIGVGEVVADIAVNNGKGRSIKWLQEAVGANPDGIIGQKTLQAIASANKPELIQRLLERRDAFYRSIAKGSQAKFLSGWLNRNASLAQLVG